jgi:hypothetical protein
VTVIIEKKGPKIFGEKKVFGRKSETLVEHEKRWENSAHALPRLQSNLRIVPSNTSCYKNGGKRNRSLESRLSAGSMATGKDVLEAKAIMIH